jgi:hypothetical protein
MLDVKRCLADKLGLARQVPGSNLGQIPWGGGGRGRYIGINGESREY